ncbi:DegT/DnrJ/EryC1/StrS family aminotransferase [Desulfovibrio sp. Huiquan2017]|uniref:DegT/DnrJ/EryC1/StrS family aminotransferase n=1 Tax=Desulfovibrio sp. Huiquan2017 TaxID=2816861 RepID=UPI001A93A053|nr:DegT/DnrJ/EryC1/StrS family aminotransferase [Desulfovibrio sp. Huiquan2017]
MPVRSKDNFLVFGAPLIGQEEIDEVVDSMKSGWLGTGPKVARFEREFSAYVGAAHAAACNSCTAALHLSLVALGLEPGDEVITTPLTFCASVNAIIHAGGTPVLADVDPVTQNIDPDRIREKITPRTKALLPVHFAGRSCDMDPIMAIANEHNLKVVEDCAHAIETTYKGRHAGTFGDFGCFSFYVTKNVCTGEGGMVIAREDADISDIKVLGLHGMSADAWKRFSDEGYKHYQVIHAGFKYNMMDIQAAIGIHQLNRVEENFKRRCEIWDMYQEAFRTLPVGTPAPEEPGTRHARHLYTLMIDPVACGLDRDQFLVRLTKENIGAGVHYLAVPEHPYYRDRYGWKLEDTPHAVALGRETLSLPLSAKLTDDDVADVIKAVNLCLGA